MTTAPTSPPDNEEPERETPRFAVPFWAWVAAVGGLGIFGVTLWQSRQLGSQLAELRRQIGEGQNRKEALEAKKRELGQIRRLLTAPGTREFRLKGRDAGTPIVRAFWNEELGILLSAETISGLAPDQTYQLWVVPKKGSPIGAGIFRPGASGSVFVMARTAAPIRVKEAKELMITEEPAGGSPRPTTDAAWVGRIK
jgi:hypothetical protein